MDMDYMDPKIIQRSNSFQSRSPRFPYIIRGVMSLEPVMFSFMVPKIPKPADSSLTTNPVTPVLITGFAGHRSYSLFVGRPFFSPVGWLVHTL